MRNLLVLLWLLSFFCGTALAAEGQRFEYDSEKGFMVDTQTGKVYHFARGVEKTLVGERNGVIEIDYVNGTVRIVRILTTEENELFRK